MAENDTRSFSFQRHLAFLSDNLAFAVDRVAQRVDYTTDHVLAYVDGSDATCTFHRVALFYLVGRPEQYGTYVIFFQVHHNGFHSVVELQQFVGFGIVQPVDTCYTVTDLKHSAHLFQMDRGVDTFQLFA